jgi:hypothetical protein
MISSQTKQGSVETSDLFIDLYAYRQRENKDPLEDWLTECLAVTIRALPRPAKAALLSELSGATVSDPQAFFDAHKVEVFTQHSTGAAGRPDMLVQLDGHPWILFENKVGHGVAAREAVDGTESHQLRGYAEWLNKQGRHCSLAKALVFVTHITQPPQDFRGADEAGLYHGLRRTHTSWAALGRRIAGLTDGLPDDHHAKALTTAFLAYLEDQDMSNEFPSSSAFAAAEVYVSQAAALENLVSRMWQELRTAANFGRTADVQLKALTDEGSVSAWRYVAPGPSSPSRNSYLQTGIWFPETGSWFDAEEVDIGVRGPQAYVYFGNGENDMFGIAPGELEGFMRPNSDFLACKPMAEFSAVPQVRGEEIIAWVAERAGVLKMFLTEHGLIA